MKRLMMIGVAFLLTAFAVEGQEATLDINKEMMNSQQETGRTLYRYTMVNDVVDSFVDRFVRRKMDKAYGYRLKSEGYSESHDAIHYCYELLRADHRGHGYLLDVYATPTDGILHTKLRANMT